MTHPLTEAAARRAALIVDRLHCEFCGDDTTELREIDHHGWTANSIVCHACFLGMSDELTFDDLKLAQ